MFQGKNSLGYLLVTVSCYHSCKTDYNSENNICKEACQHEIWTNDEAGGLGGTT